MESDTEKIKSYAGNSSVEIIDVEKATEGNRIDHEIQVVLEPNEVVIDTKEITPLQIWI